MDLIQHNISVIIDDIHVCVKIRELVGECYEICLDKPLGNDDDSTMNHDDDYNNNHDANTDEHERNTDDEDNDFYNDRRLDTWIHVLEVK